MAIVYRHIRLDKNEVFYIGIGKTEKELMKNIIIEVNFGKIFLKLVMWLKLCLTI